MTAYVALLTSYLSARAGGLAACVPGLANALERRGSDAVVLGLADRTDAGDDGMLLHRVRGPAAFGYAPEMAVALRSFTPQVTDVQGLWMYPSLANLRHHRETGTPYVVTPHGMLDPWARARSAWKKRAVRILYEDAHLARAACLRATAEMEAGHFRSFGLRSPIAIVPNGVDLPHSLPPRPNGPRRMLFLSRLHPKKGIEHLLRVWARLEAHHPDWSLVIAGPDEGGHRAEMQALAVRLRVAKVEWHEAVEGADKTALYRSADCFVLPTHAENFGLVVAEALAHEVPVITTRNAPWEGLGEQGCGWWVPLSDAALYEAMAAAMALPPTALAKMGELGRRWISRDFGWEGVAARMERLYRWVAGQGPCPDFVYRA